MGWLITRYIRLTFPPQDRGERVRKPSTRQQNNRIQGTDWKRVQVENGRQRKYFGKKVVTVQHLREEHNGRERGELSEIIAR